MNSVKVLNFILFEFAAKVEKLPIVVKKTLKNYLHLHHGNQSFQIRRSIGQQFQRNTKSRFNPATVPE
jgi:hypothetical protein